MTKIFDTNRIKENDSLREQKVNDLNTIKNYLQAIDKDIKLEALEKGLWNIIRQHILSYQKENLILRKITEKYPDLENDWHEKIVNITDLKDVKRISTIVKNAIITYSGFITDELNKMKERTKELWLNDDYRAGDIAKFDAKCPSYNNDWKNETARIILREILLIREGNHGATQWHDEAFKRIMDNLHGAKFQFDRREKSIEIIDAYGKKWNEAGFKWWMKHNIIGSPNLDDKRLPVGQSRADLLRKLEEVIQNGKANEMVYAYSSDENDENIKSESESNIKDESQDQDSNQNQGSEEVNAPLISEENIKPESSQEEELMKVKKEVIKRYREEMDKEPRVKNEELPSETRDLISQIAKTKDIQHLLFIQSMFVSDFNIIRSRRLRGAELEETIQKFQNGQVDSNDFINAFTKMDYSLGEEDNEEKRQELRKVMIQNDPEQFFSSFVKWVKEEEEKLEKIKQALTEEKEATNESEWSAEEEKFLNGEIVDQQQREAIAERIEVKIKTKKESWSWKKWIREWTKWLKAKARLLRKSNKVGFEKQAAKIRQEIKNMENNSNIYAQQTYQNNQEQTQALLRELDNISQENQTVVPTEKGFFRPEIIVPLSISMVVLAIITTIVIRRRKLAKAKN